MAPSARDDDDLRAQRYVSFREFGLRRDEGWFSKLGNMSRLERIDRFGAPVVPIYGPLEAWESPNQYENRFADWLRDVHNMRLERLCRGDPMAERSFRRQFAWDKFLRRDRPTHRKRPRETTVTAAWTPRKRGKSDDTASGRPPTAKPTKEDTPEPAVKREPRARREEETQLSDGSDEPRSTGMRTTDSKPRRSVDLTNADKDVGAAITRLAVVSCATSDRVGQDAQERGSVSAVVLGDDDPIETRLWDAYASQNQRVLDNELAVEMLSARLFRGLTAADEIQRLRDDIDRRREVIRCSVEKRGPAVAILVAYLWRQKVVNMRLLIQQAGSRDSAAIQRASHRKAATWAATIKTKQSEVSQLGQDLDSAMSSAEGSSSDAEWMERIANLNDALVAAEQELNDAREKRREELKVLVHFDKRLRLDVEKIFKKAGEA